MAEAVHNNSTTVPARAPAAEKKLLPGKELFAPEPAMDVDWYKMRIQPKLTVGAPDDPYEKEADAVADTVMRMPENNFVQLKCAACEEEDRLQEKADTPAIQRSLTVSDDNPVNMPANDIADTIPLSAKIAHFTTIIQSLCPAFTVDASGLVVPVANPAPSAASLSSGSNPLGCCGLNVLVNGVNPWKIETSQLLGPHTEPGNHVFVLPPAGSAITFGDFTGAGARANINDVVVAGHEIIGHGAQEELGIHNTGDEDRESFNHHDPTVRIQNIIAHEQGIPASEDRGLAASGIHRGESFAKVEISQFPFNSSDITQLPAPEQSKLQLIANFILTNGMWVDIIGHSDPVGSAAAKQQVSDSRAQAVRTRLIQLGVTATFSKSLPTYQYNNRPRYTRVAGVSDTQPPATGVSNHANWRRVEIFVVNHPAGTEVPPADIPALQQATPGPNLPAEQASADPCHRLLANSAFPAPPSPAPAVQPKLLVGSPGDAWEKEADAVADTITRAPEQHFIQQKCTECEKEETLHRKPVASTPFVQAKMNNDAPAVSDTLAQSIESSRGSGSPMDDATQTFMSNRFGTDFSQVKIHTGSEAAHMNRELQAKAFTTGSDIYFNEGQYQPGSDSGKQLLAHELTHVLQQNGTGSINRKDEAGKGSFQRMDIIQTDENGLNFEVDLVYEKEQISFQCNLLGKEFLSAGSYTLTAPPADASEHDTSEVVLFYLEEANHPYIYIRPADEDKKKIKDLWEVKAWLVKGNSAPLQIIPYSKAAGDGKGEKKEGDTQGSKFISAEAWLDKELLPAVKASIDKRESAYKPDKLIGYQSLPIQEMEGKDVSMIQVEKENTPKKLVVHVKVHKSRWVNQKQEAQQHYAELVATEILTKLETARLTTIVPAWVMTLKQKVEAKIAEIRKQAAASPPTDLPDRLSVDVVGDTNYFHIFISQKAANEDKEVWHDARMTPALAESDLNAVDKLVDIVRAQTALLRSRPVKTGGEEEKGITNVLMPETPAQISALNVMNATTVTGATNEFEMVVKLGTYFGINNPNIDLVTKAMQIMPADLEFKWKVIFMDDSNREQLLKTAAGDEEKNIRDEAVKDFAKKDVDPATKTETAFKWVNYKDLLLNSSYPDASGSKNKFEYQFPAGKEGIYLVLCRVTPHSLQEGDTKKIFPDSYAVMPVRVLSQEALAKEFDEAPEKLQENKKLLQDPSLSEEDKKSIQKEIDKMEKEEQMSEADLTKQSLADLRKKMEQLQKLKKWMIEDARQNKTISGNEKENPFLVRLQLYDRSNDENLFRTWRELYSIAGIGAYDSKNLDKDFKQEDAQLNPLNKYMAAVNTQIESAEKLLTQIEGVQKGFQNGASQRVVATLVTKGNGQSIPLLLMLGETKESKAGAYIYRIVDLTFSQTPLFEKIDHVFTGDAAADKDTAIRNAFVKYGEDNKYDEGTVFFRLASGGSMQQVPNVKTITEWAEQIAMYLALIGAIVSVAFTGGASTPAAAAILAIVAVANLALASFLAYKHLSRRKENDTLELDTDVALEIINVIASAVGVASMAKVAQLGRLAKAAKAAGDVGKAVAAVARIETIGKLMLVFDVTTIGATAVLVGVKVSDDVAKINALKIPQSQKDVLLKQVAYDAVMQGAMLAFQTAMMARSHIEMAKEKLENASYRSMEERNWIDAEGNITASAPPALREAGLTGELNNTQKPAFNMEEEAGLLFDAVKEQGSTVKTDDPDYDAIIKIKNSDNEEHTYNRRREDGTWCRHSRNPACFFNNKEIEDLLRPLDAFIGPSAKGSSRPARKAPGDWPGLTKDIEATMEQGAADLRTELGKKWLEPWLYGTRLHKKVADIFRSMKMPKGWQAVIEKPLNEFVKMGALDAKTARMKVKDFLKASPWGKTFGDALPENLLNKTIGQLEPDLVLITPDGNLIVWDLTPRSETEHLAKTMLYAHILGGNNRITQIGESYYKWQAHIELNTAEQAAFSTGKNNTPTVKLNDNKILSLLKKYAGTGVQQGKLTPGVSQSAELITGNKEIIGQYYDAKSKSMKDTASFLIHYSADGLYIEPVKP